VFLRRFFHPEVKKAAKRTVGPPRTKRKVELPRASRTERRVGVLRASRTKKRVGVKRASMASKKKLIGGWDFQKVKSIISR
jgi:hypothetical protein